MREKFLNSAGLPAAKLNRVSFRNTFTLSPYSAGFCRQSSRTSASNCKKANILGKPALNSGQKSTANSLFQNILRVSPSGSIICEGSHRSISRNINKMSILQNHKEKKWGGVPGGSNRRPGTHARVNEVSNPRFLTLARSQVGTQRLDSKAINMVALVALN